ncbi:MAG: gfo/Idh/MocA family oxidoreductase, partial [Caldilineaceae bacterium]|nr:gfo/Idh/MocA family oxidoreductase [Caldilineaceae bacterium]
LRTGFEMFTAVGQGGYVAEKAESETGWLFPVGDELSELGYVDMFTDMFNALDRGSAPMESFYDGYVVNAILDACYKSMETKQWEPVQLEVWRGSEEVMGSAVFREYDQDHLLIKEVKMPDGKCKLIKKEKESGKILQRVV